MFSIRILSGQPRMIEIRENGNSHCIPLFSEFWCDLDFYSNWMFNCYDLIDGYAVNFMFTGMTRKGSKLPIRAFRTVRTRNLVHFDDVLLQSPWSIASWDPESVLEYVSSKKYFPIYDYQFSTESIQLYNATRIPEFTITLDELIEWHGSGLENNIPEDYDPDYPLYWIDEDK